MAAELIVPHLGTSLLPESAGGGSLHCFMVTIVDPALLAEQAEQAAGGDHTYQPLTVSLAGFIYQILYREGKLEGEPAVLIFAVTPDGIQPALVSHIDHKMSQKVAYPPAELTKLYLRLLKVDRSENTDHLVYKIEVDNGKVTSGRSFQLPGGLPVPELPGNMPKPTMLAPLCALTNIKLA